MLRLPMYLYDGMRNLSGFSAVNFDEMKCKQRNRDVGLMQRPRVLLWNGGQPYEAHAPQTLSITSAKGFLVFSVAARRCRSRA